MKHTFKKICHMIFVVFMFMSVSNDSPGKSISSTLKVTAKVPVMLEFNIIHEPKFLKVSKHDVKKGFVDINDGLIYSIRTNNLNGYILNISSLESDIISRIVIIMPNQNSFEIFPGGDIDIPMPYPGKKDIIKIRFKFYLKPDTEVGKYTWPITESVYPL